MNYEVVINGKVIEIRRPRNPEEYRRVSEAEVEIWGVTDPYEVVPHHLLIAADRRGGVVLGAFERDTNRVVGICYGIPAITSDGRPYLYSHSTGVVSEYRDKGLGYMLKLVQRDYAISHGLDLIAWTYDPIQPLNARFNVGKLGVIVRKFYIDYYGELRDEINRGMPTDRFEAEWWIMSELVKRKLFGRLRSPTLDEVLDVGAVTVTSVEFIGKVPVLVSYELSLSNPLILVEIPGELDVVRSNHDLLLKWRLNLREVFNYYINRYGYIVTEFVSTVEGGVRRNFYVLWKVDLNKVLSGDFPWSYVR